MQTLPKMVVTVLAFPRIARSIRHAAHVALCLLIVGCVPFSRTKPSESGPSRLVIPDYTTAASQFSYAARYQNSQVISAEPEKRARQLNEITQCYQKVITNFPDDLTYTPQAHLSICTCVAASGRYQQAVEMYREVMRKYPDNDYLLARCMYQSARALDQEGKYQEAKEIYKEVVEKYRDTQDSAVREVAKRSAIQYQRVHRQPRQ